MQTPFSSSCAVKLPAEIIETILILLATWAKCPRLALDVSKSLHRQIQGAIVSLLHLCKIETASDYGPVALDWWISDPSRRAGCSSWAIDLASQRGDLDTLEWWRNSGLPLHWTKHGPLSAAEQGNVLVLKWWRDNYANFVHLAPEILRCASESSNLDVLDWWKSEGLPLVCDRSLSVKLTETGNEVALDWWKTAGVKLKCSSTGILLASHNRHIGVLDWWANSGFKFSYVINGPMDYASRHGHIEVLDWWKQSRFAVTWSSRSMDEAKNPQVLEWWRQSGFKLKYSNNAIYLATIRSKFPFLEWWKSSGLPLKYDECSVFRDSRYSERRQEILEWWKRSGLPVQWVYTGESWTEFCIQEGHQAIISWLSDNKDLFIHEDQSKCSNAKCKRKRLLRKIRRLLTGPTS
ncbi:hypothetical protein BJ742DRAFT_823895 [Cladochytrium replicatum]|nr:hypothetical protein BJ742DRAFT_823895 [Cladochytrium replicatum]